MNPDGSPLDGIGIEEGNMMERNVAIRSLIFGISMLAFGCAQTKVTTAPPKNPKTAASDADGPEFADVLDASDAPPGAEAKELQSEVIKVTVYSDRAQVTRRATAEATTEPQLFAFRKLPGWVDDGSVRISASAGRIADVRVERSFLARTTDASYRKAEEELKALTRQMAEVTDEIAILDAQKAQIDSIKAFSLEKIDKDTVIGDISVQSYSDVMTFISDALRKTAKERRDAQAKQEALAPKVVAAQRKLDDMKALLQLEETTVLVTLQASRAAKSELELTYMMPGATWEPMHELRASTTDSKVVEVSSFAVVTQTSGEDWGDAELYFSTQSTTESVRIPELEALTLGDTTTASRTMTSRMSSFSRAQQAFAGQSALWNKVHSNAYAATAEAANFEQVYQSNMQYLQVVQSKTVQIFETLRNRGTTAQFKAIAVNSVRGDGHQTRLRIGSSTLEAKQRILAVPEQTLNAARTLDMVNSSGQPLLPGKVALYQDGAFIGMTEIDFVAQDEKFSLFLSVADHLKLSRTLDRKQSSLVHRQVSKMTVTFVVTAENLSAEATSLTLADRIPVSENREIRVSGVKVTPAGSPDSQGILRWDLVLKPKEKREFRIGYQVEYPRELIIDAQRRRASRPAGNVDFDDMASPYQAGEMAAPPMPAPAKSMNMEDQIMDLESQL
jgi:uncharacterized protein (TIGR02231 family)